MPEKPNAKVKTSNKASTKKKAPAREATSTARVKSAKPKTADGYYVVYSELKVSISDQKPATSGARRFATYQQARQAALEAIVTAIEDAEAQLMELKRAENSQAK
jgi:hypothetical protein